MSLTEWFAKLKGEAENLDTAKLVSELETIVKDVEELRGFVTSFAGLVKTYGFTSALLREVEALYDDFAKPAVVEPAPEPTPEPAPIAPAPAPEPAPAPAQTETEPATVESAPGS